MLAPIQVKFVSAIDAGTSVREYEVSPPAYTPPPLDDVANENTQVEFAVVLQYAVACVSVHADCGVRQLGEGAVLVGVRDM